MHIRLGSEALQQLEAIMRRKGYSSHLHTLNLMLSQITKNFAKHDAKQAGSDLHNV